MHLNFRGNDSTAFTLSRTKIHKQYITQPIYSQLVDKSIDNMVGPGGDGVFSVQGTVDLSHPQQLYFTPGLAYVLKMGWIQYLSMLVIIASIVYPLYSIVVVNGMVSTFTSVDDVGGRKMKVY